jgi:putative ABC transport system ATP-binding protein
MASLFEAKSLVIDVERSEGSLRVLDGVSFSMEPGEVTDLVGPSGSGKSTLLLAMARLRPVTSGELMLLGRTSSQVDGVEWRQQIVYVPQKATLFLGTVEDNLLAPWKLACRREKTPPTRERIRRDLDRIGLDDVELERDMARLSGGQAARIALLRALLLEAPLTLLDEVDAALDDASASMVGALVSEEAREGRSFLRVRHRAPDGFATRRLRLAEGSLVEVPVADEVADVSPDDCVCGEGR